MWLWWLAPALVLLWGIVTFNRLITHKNKVKNAWSDIEVQLKRRADLIPNLVTVVKQYAQYEQQTLQQIVAARQQAQGLNQCQQQEQALSQSLKQLLMLVEDYPQLAADQQFLQLQTELVDSEQHIQSARRYFNGATRDYNTAIEQFPALIIARLLAFKAGDFFTLDSASEALAPKVLL